VFFASDEYPPIRCLSFRVCSYQNLRTAPSQLEERKQLANSITKSEQVEEKVTIFIFPGA